MRDDVRDGTKRVPVSEVEVWVRDDGARDEPGDFRAHETHLRRVERIEVRLEVQSELHVRVPVDGVEHLEVLGDARSGRETAAKLDVPLVHVVLHRVHGEGGVEALLHGEELGGEPREGALRAENLLLRRALFVPRHRGITIRRRAGPTRRGRRTRTGTPADAARVTGRGAGGGLGCATRRDAAFFALDALAFVLVQTRQHVGFDANRGGGVAVVVVVDVIVVLGIGGEPESEGRGGGSGDSSRRDVRVVVGGSNARVDVARGGVDDAGGGDGRLHLGGALERDAHHGQRVDEVERLAAARVEECVQGGHARFVVVLVARRRRGGSGVPILRRRERARGRSW